MTGLYSRDEFERWLKTTFADIYGSQDQHVLLYMDRHQFKVVNDAAGRAAGDQLMMKSSLFIKDLACKTHTAARLGEDEFAVLFEHCFVESAKNLARKLCERIDIFRFRFDAQTFHVGAGIGLVPIDRRWLDTESILSAADAACFAAKEGGRNRFHTCRARDQVIGSHQLAMRWVRRIEQALDVDRFVLHWQRITPLKASYEGTHCEILLRMVDDDGRLIAPSAFLPSAVRFGIATRIDRWVIRTMLRWMVDNYAALTHVATVSINLSGHSVGDREFHTAVINLLESALVDAGKLCFEVTETATIASLYDATALFEAMRRGGIRLSLDDFGSGVASFGCLKQLPVDYLKIDGQFICNLSNDCVDQATVRCIHEVAQITGKKPLPSLWSRKKSSDCYGKLESITRKAFTLGKLAMPRGHSSRRRKKILQRTECLLRDRVCPFVHQSPAFVCRSAASNE